MNIKATKIISEGGGEILNSEEGTNLGEFRRLLAVIKSFYYYYCTLYGRYLYLVQVLIPGPVPTRYTVVFINKSGG
jgi:hypothetical protein